MEVTLGIAVVLEVLVLGVLVVALWQDRRSRTERERWEGEMRGLTHGEDLNAATRY
jgi:hypothetical protein